MAKIIRTEEISDLIKKGALDRREGRKISRSERPQPKEPDKADLLIKELKAISETSGKSVKMSKQVFITLIQVVESLRDRPIVVNIPGQEKKKLNIRAKKSNGIWEIWEV